MKTNQVNLNKLRAQAQNEARKAEAERALRKEQKAKPRRKKLVPTIESRIEGIYNLLVSNARESEVVVKERVSHGLSCKGIVSVYHRNDYMLQLEAEEARKNYKAKFGETQVPKPYKAKARVTYVFYPSVYDSAKIGSVAIYGKDALSIGVIAKRYGTLFGVKIKSASAEMGRQPYYSIKF